MSDQTYPYQTEQDFIDQYLAIPANERPPLEEYTQAKFQGVADWANAVMEVMRPMFEATWATLRPVGMAFWLCKIQAENKQAADRRRKWRKKPSTIGY